MLCKKSLKVNFLLSHLFAFLLFTSLNYIQKRKKIIRTTKNSILNVVALKITYVFILFFLIAASLQAQWSTDPNNNLIVGYGLDPHICSDSSGGCYITYDYESIYYPRKLALERLNEYGYKPWGTFKQILGELPEQSGAQIVEDGEGGVIVSYKDRFENLPSWTQSIRVQRVDSSGNFLWGQTGVKVTLDEINQSLQQVVADGSGGCVVTWKTVSYTFYANRISANGERIWSDSGILLGISNYSGTEPRVIRAIDGCFYVETGEYIYRIGENGEIVRRDSVILGNIVPDPQGGIVLSGKVGSINNRMLAAQRKDSLGNNLWQEPYVEIADSLGLGSFRIGINNRIINYAWLGTYNGQTDRPCFQAINMDGNILYQNKILLSEDPSGTTLIGIISSYENNTIFSWSISGEVNSIFAQLYDTLGNKIWSENGIIVAHPRITNQKYTTDGRKGFIVCGTVNEFTVVAQQVSRNGYLGEIVTNIFSNDNNAIVNELILNQNFPNPFNSNCTIQYSVPSDGNIIIELFNTLGEKVKTLINNFHTKGVFTVNLSSDDLSSGIYHYRLQTENKSLTKKLIIIK